MKFFTEKTIPIVVALFVLFAAALFMPNANLIGLYALQTENSIEGQSTLGGATLNYPMLAGIIIVLVALVSIIAYFGHANVAKGHGKSGKITRGRKKRKAK